MKHVIKRLTGISFLVLGLLFISNFAVAQDESKTKEPPKEDPVDPQQVADALKMAQIEAILAYTYGSEDGKEDGSTETKEDQKGTATGGADSDTKGWGSLPAKDIQNIMKMRAIEDILAGITGDEGSGNMGFADDERGAVADELKGKYVEDPAPQAETIGKESDRSDEGETKEDQKADTHGWGAVEDQKKAEALKEKTEEDPTPIAETMGKDNDKSDEGETKEDQKADTHGWGAVDDEKKAEALKEEAKEAEEKLEQIAETLSTDSDVKGYASPRRCNCSTMSCYISCLKRIVKVKPKKKIKHIRVKK